MEWNGHPEIFSFPRVLEIFRHSYFTEKKRSVTVDID